MAKVESITQEKKDVIRNLYLSGIGEEFIAMQLDLEIPIVIDVLKELEVYKAWDQNLSRTYEINYICGKKEKFLIIEQISHNLDSMTRKFKYTLVWFLLDLLFYSGKTL